MATTASPTTLSPRLRAYATSSASTTDRRLKCDWATEFSAPGFYSTPNDATSDEEMHERADLDAPCVNPSGNCEGTS